MKLSDLVAQIEALTPDEFEEFIRLLFAIVEARNGNH
jgi:hypothetical protein